MADRDSAEVFVLTDEEAKRALQATLDYAGVASYDELEAQAKSGRFSSTRASDAWYAIPPGWANA
ncbi:MAG: hypothetical protein OXE75_07185 [bacterium]|nr:hypothetical protein [bacterium]